MKNKQTPVEFLEITLGLNSYPKDGHIQKNIQKAKAMEAEREAKYQKMLEMLNTCRISFKMLGINGAEQDIEQLIKEAE